MSCSISIMAHPSRRKFVNYLKFKLGEDTPCYFDTKNNIWDTCKNAWRLYDKDKKFHLVIQDDAILCDDFYGRLNNLLNHFRNADVIFSLYIGDRRKFQSEVDKLKPRGGLLIKKNIYHEIALIIPTRRIDDMINFCEKFNPDNDKIINKYVTENNLPVIIPVPTLIDHRIGNSLHSLNRSKIQKRKSIWFIGR